MGSMDQADEMTFKINFNSQGLVKLRDKVNYKLKEFMGDYTDDTLVDYVIVLLRNGRSKEEARTELNVFLGDDSDSFISWLWDDLSSNLNLYAQPQDSSSNEATKTKPSLGDQASPPLESDSDRGKSSKLTRRRRNSEWKGPVRNGADPPPLLSSEIHDTQVKEKASHARRSPSPSLQRKRSFRDDQQHPNRETASQATANAHRRLLQFAVRDAVESLRPSNSVNEPSLKRLRSVVSTSTSYPSVVERPRRIQSVARVPNRAHPMATVIKAVEEAAEYVRKANFSRNVFDRLGPDMDVSEIADQVTDSRRVATEDDEHLDYDQIEEEIQSPYLQRSNYSGVRNMLETETHLPSDFTLDYSGVRNMPLLEAETQLPSDFMSEKGYDDDADDMDNRVVNAAQTGTSGGYRDDGLTRAQMHSFTKHTDDIMHDQPAVVANRPRRTVSSSVSDNSWISPHYQRNGKNSVHAAAIGKSVVQLMKDNITDAPAGNGNAKPVLDVQKESQTMLQSGTYTAGPLLEDTDSRIIFVSNVHFAATKDLLTRHFNKFGEVLRVVIVTDAATGQPKGSAYVEFMQKEAADDALSVNGTSFMSRIVKVVKRTAAQQEAAPVVAWPRARGSPYSAARFSSARGSPYGAARFSRVAFPRGGAFRGRLPIKPGARSMQWKRDSPGTTEGASLPGSSVPSPTARSLTYVRPEAKQGNSGGTYIKGHNCS